MAGRKEGNERSGNNAKVSQAYRVEPHHPEDPDGEGEVDDQDDDEQEDKQVEAALPPAIDADLVDMVRHRPGHAAALGGGDVLFPHHLLAGRNTRTHTEAVQKDVSTCEKIAHMQTLLWHGVPESEVACQGSEKHYGMICNRSQLTTHNSVNNSFFLALFLERPLRRELSSSSAAKC